jgi:hypothetical protein
MHGRERFRDDRIGKTGEKTLCARFQPYYVAPQQFQESQFHQAADDQVATRSWMLTFGIVHVEQGAHAPGYCTCHERNQWHRIGNCKALRHRRSKSCITGRRKEVLDAALKEIGAGVIGVQADASNLDDPQAVATVFLAL